MVKHFKNLLSRNHWANFDETLYKLQRPKLFIFCSNSDPLLALTYFMQGQILQVRLLQWEMGQCTMDSLEIIASCDLEFG